MLRLNFQPPPPRGTLTDIHIQEISERITAQTTLRRLGVKLGLPDHTINTIFTNYQQDITQQAYWVIRTWRNNKASAEKAFAELWKALCNSGRVDIAYSVLKSEATRVEPVAELSKHLRVLMEHISASIKGSELIVR